MQQAVDFIQSESAKDSDNISKQIYLMGLIGGYATFLHDFKTLEQALNTAL